MELNWNQRLGHKKTKLNICHHTLTLFTQLQNSSFQVVEGTRTSSKCQKMKMHVQSVKKYCFSLSNMQICGVAVVSSLIFIRCYASCFSVLYIECPSTSPDTVCDWRTKEQVIKHKQYPYPDVNRSEIS